MLKVVSLTFLHGLETSQVSGVCNPTLVVGKAFRPDHQFSLSVGAGFSLNYISHIVINEIITGGIKSQKLKLEVVKFPPATTSASFWR